MICKLTHEYVIKCDCNSRLVLGIMVKRSFCEVDLHNLLVFLNASIHSLNNIIMFNHIRPYFIGMCVVIVSPFLLQRKSV